MSRCSRAPILVLAFVLLLPASDAGADGFIASSLERYNFQVGDADLELRSYDGFDEIDGLGQVTGLSLSINGGTAEDIPFDDFYQAFKRGENYETLEQMLAERPIDGSYVHDLEGNPSGQVEIVAPGHDFDDAIPIDPLFTISGVAGCWGIGFDDVVTFFFDPERSSSFTVSLNAFSATTTGGDRNSGIFVNDITTGFEPLGEYATGLLPGMSASNTLEITFTRGLAHDGEDADPRTYGFDAGSRFELEGEHVNVFDLSDAGLGTDVAQKAFIFQTVTAFNLVALEPDDLDRDGVGADTDNCVLFPNEQQADSDEDGVGDACDFDWGDVWPSEVPDGEIDVSDVVYILRIATGLVETDEALLKRAHLAPSSEVGGELLPELTGCPFVDIGDAILALRVAVGLEVMARPF